MSQEPRTFSLSAADKAQLQSIVLLFLSELQGHKMLSVDKNNLTEGVQEGKLWSGSVPCIYVSLLLDPLF